MHTRRFDARSCNSWPVREVFVCPRGIERAGRGHVGHGMPWHAGHALLGARQAALGSRDGLIFSLGRSQLAMNCWRPRALDARVVAE